MIVAVPNIRFMAIPSGHTDISFTWVFRQYLTVSERPPVWANNDLAPDPARQRLEVLNIVLWGQAHQGHSR